MIDWQAFLLLPAASESYFFKRLSIVHELWLTL
jgi:hypothetical protein